MKFKDFQAPVLFFKYFQGLEFKREKIKYFQGCMGTLQPSNSVKSLSQFKQLNPMALSINSFSMEQTMYHLCHLSDASNCDSFMGLMVFYKCFYLPTFTHSAVETAVYILGVYRDSM